MTQSGHRLTSRPTPSSVLVGVKYNAMSEPQGQAGETLCDIMLDNKTPAAARVAATNSILDRGCGRPSQTINQHVADKPVDQMTDDGLIARIRAFEESLSTH